MAADTKSGAGASVKPLHFEFLWCSKCKKETVAVSNGEVTVTIGGLECGGPYTVRERLPVNRGRLAEVLRA